MKLPVGKGLRSNRWFPNEIMASQDVDFVRESAYTNLTALLVSLQASISESVDYVLGGLRLMWSAALTTYLKPGAALSYTGYYYSNVGVWGFTASAGDAFSVWNGQDQTIVFDTGSASDRYDTVEIRPTQTDYDSKARNYKDPITRIITAALTFTKTEFGAEYRILKGTPGAGVAPTHTAGWIKVAEVFVPALATAIAQSNIKDVRDSATWTSEAAITKERITTFIETLLDDRTSEEAQDTLVIGQSQFTPMSGYTPAVGDVVELLLDGTIRKAKRAATTVLASGSNVYGIRIAKLDSTRFVVCYGTSSSPATGPADLNAVVGTIDPRTLSISYGTPVVVYTWMSFPQFVFDVAFVSTDKVLVGYTQTTGFAQLSVVTLSISGTTITLNTPVNGAAAAQGVTFARIPSTTNIAMMYATSGTVVAAAIVSISGTVPTINTPATVSFVYAGPVRINFIVESTGAMIELIGATGTSPYPVTLYYWPISGTTLSSPTALSLNYQLALNAYSRRVAMIEEVPAGRLAIYFRTSVVTTNVEDMIGIGSQRIMGTGGGNYSDGQMAPFHSLPFAEYAGGLGDAVMFAAPKSDGVMFMGGRAQDWVWPEVTSATFRAMFAKRIGATGAWIYGDVYSFEPGDSGFADYPFIGGCLLDDESTCLLGIQSQDASKSVILALRRRNGIIGVAADTTGKVMLSRSLTTSGLTTGKKYYADDNGDLTTVVGEVEIGIAASTTKLLLAIKPGI